MIFDDLVKQHCFTVFVNKMFLNDKIIKQATYVDEKRNIEQRKYVFSMCVNEDSCPFIQTTV